MSFFTSQPFSMNSTANQSNSLGCVGLSPWDPRSSRSRARPLPKNCFQIRFTNTRAVSGLSREAIQRARSSRVAWRSPVSSLPRKAGIEGDMTGPVSSNQLPRGSMRTVRGLALRVTSVLGHFFAFVSCPSFFSKVMILEPSSCFSFSRVLSSTVTQRTTGTTSLPCPSLWP